MTSPVAILFDADGVVQRAAPNRRTLWTQLLGGREDTVEAFLHDLFAIERVCYHGQDQFVSLLPDVLNRWNCVGTVDDALRAWTAIEVDQAVLGVIATAKEFGVRCHLATNQEPYRGRFMAQKLPYREVFDRQFYSCELGIAKPDSTYFTEILRVLNVSPEDVLFVDDIEANVRAASSVGIRGEVFASLPGADAGEAMRQVLLRHGALPGRTRP